MQSRVPASLGKDKKPSNAEFGQKKMQIHFAVNGKVAQKCSYHSVTVEAVTKPDNNCKEKQGGILLLRKNSSQQGKANAFRIRFAVTHTAEKQQPRVKC